MCVVHYLHFWGRTFFCVVDVYFLCPTSETRWHGMLKVSPLWKVSASDADRRTNTKRRYVFHVDIWVEVSPLLGFFPPMNPLESSNKREFDTFAHQTTCFFPFPFFFFHPSLPGIKAKYDHCQSDGLRSCRSTKWWSAHTRKGNMNLDPQKLRRIQNSQQITRPPRWRACVNESSFTWETEELST